MSKQKAQDVLESVEAIRDLIVSGNCDGDDLERAVDFELKFMDKAERDAFLFSVLAILSELFKSSLTAIKDENRAVKAFETLRNNE